MISTFIEMILVKPSQIHGCEFVVVYCSWLDSVIPFTRDPFTRDPFTLPFDKSFCMR